MLMMSSVSNSNPDSPQGLSGYKIILQISISAVIDQCVALIGRVQPGTYFHVFHTEEN